MSHLKNMKKFLFIKNFEFWFKVCELFASKLVLKHVELTKQKHKNQILYCV